MFSSSRSSLACVLMAAVVLGSGFASAGGYQLTKREEAVFKTLIIDEVTKWVDGGDAMMTREAPYPRVTAADFSQAYAENEIAADEKYKGKLVLVVGTVMGVSKDAFG